MTATSMPDDANQMDDAPILLTREEVLQLPGRERIPWLKHMRVRYPLWNRLHAEIRYCHQMNAASAEPLCMMLVGPTGAGKSTLINSYAAEYPPVIGETNTTRHVVVASTPTPATVKNLMTAILYALGDPLYANGTIGGMTYRIHNYFKDCQTELLILDELQHFVDWDSQKILLNASNALKSLIKETGVACVLVGLEGQAEQVVTANPQLGRLFGDPKTLTPFCWRSEEPETIQEFRTFLQNVEALLPLREPSDLSEVELAWRCYVGSSGIVSYVMNLLRVATTIALRHDRESLDLGLLAAAFDERMAGVRREIANPFVGPAPATMVPRPQPQHPSPKVKRSNNKAR